MIQLLKNAVFMWGLLVSIVSGTAFYVTKYSEFITTHPLELGIIALIFTLSLRTHLMVSTKVSAVEVKVDDGIKSLRVSLIKSSISAFYRCHKDKSTLSEDEGKQLYDLHEEMKSLGVNSYNEHRIDELKKIPIK